MAGVVLVTDLFERQRGLTHQVVGCARHGQLRPEMARGETRERWSHRQGADDRHRGTDDRLQPHLGGEQRDHGRGERTQRKEERVERLGVDFHAHEDQAGEQPDHPHPGQHAASVPTARKAYTGGSPAILPPEARSSARATRPPSVAQAVRLIASWLKSVPASCAWTRKIPNIG